MFIIEFPAGAVVSVGSIIAGRANSLFPRVVRITEGLYALHEQANAYSLLAAIALSVSARVQ